MNCNCNWTETILAVILIVFSVIVDVTWSKWVVFGVGVILIIHAWTCQNCGTCKPKMPKAKKK